MLVKFISTHDQLADLFTKCLPSPRFNWLTSKLMWKFPIRLRGDESHSSASKHLNKEEEDGSTVATTTPKMVLSIQMSKHKTCLKQNIIVSH